MLASILPVSRILKTGLASFTPRKDSRDDIGRTADSRWDGPSPAMTPLRPSVLYYDEARILRSSLSGGLSGGVVRGN